MLLVQLILPQGSNYCLRVCYNTVNINNLKPLCTEFPSDAQKPARDLSLLEGAGRSVFPEIWQARDSSATHNPTCIMLLLCCGSHNRLKHNQSGGLIAIHIHFSRTQVRLHAGRKWLAAGLKVYPAGDGPRDGVGTQRQLYWAWSNC